jgi:hypothetical protein
MIRAAKSSLPATFEEGLEAAMMKHASAKLESARSAFEGGDPFIDATMRAAIRTMLKAIAESNELSAAYVVGMAVEGFADAHAALAEMIAERNERGEALRSSALITYVNMLATRGTPHARPPEGRPSENFLAAFVIVCLLIDLQLEFPGLKLRRSGSRRPSACSIVSAVLIEARISRGGEEAIRKIWEQYGPPAIPVRFGPPPPGVTRFISG